MCSEINFVIILPYSKNNFLNFLGYQSIKAHRKNWFKITLFIIKKKRKLVWCGHHKTFFSITELKYNSTLKISIEYFFSHIYHRKTCIKGWINFKWTVRKCDQVRNRTWDLPITRGTLCHLNYLSTITWQAHYPITRVSLSSHSAHSRLEKWKKEIP